MWGLRFGLRFSGFEFLVSVQDLLTVLEVWREIPHKFVLVLFDARAAFLGMKFDVLASREAVQISNCHLISGFRCEVLRS